ncbi:MAG: hypothetical protein IPG54_10380 [Sphingomonadales bacterium]|jgi:hypothetical protein|nr:hypothetical protein [Sphingomonadales bacterium]MBK9004114.1 hypothetical protein [Sphingomonadales bacterium]MBK9269290.1 hypothetical protein [Sphingomonadales bacterium]MBP6433876.1 hypothetical protein [Sphingorhabdus sp.]
MGSRLLILPTIILGLSSCAGPIETRVVSSGAGLREPFSILAEDPPKSETAASARTLVLDQLAGAGYRQSDNGSLQLQVAFAERDAGIAVQTKSGETIHDVAVVKPRKPLQSCADRELRLTVTLTRIADGAELYRGSAAEYHCKARPTDVIPALVEASLDDLSSPKGAYTTTRQGLE